LFELIGEEELRLLLAGVCLDVQLPVMLVNRGGETVHRPGGIAGWPELCDFCREFRQDPEARNECRRSEREVGLRVINGETNESWGAPCHMHLLGVGVPIRAAGMTLGAALTGQLRRADLDAAFEDSIASWESKLGRARVDKLRSLYRELPRADEDTIGEKQGRLSQGVARIESIASGAFSRERNSVEKAFLADLGFELSKTTREDPPLRAAVEALGRALSGFLDSPDYCVALYEGKGGRRLQWATHGWGDPQPAKFVTPSVVHEAAGRMKCRETAPDLLAAFFSSAPVDLGVVVSRFDHQGKPFAVMFASRRAAARLKAFPQLISSDLWIDVATAFGTAFSEFEYSQQLRKKVEDAEAQGQALRAYVEKAVHDLKMPLSAIVLHAEDALQGLVAGAAKRRVQAVLNFSDELATKILSLVRGSAEEVGEGAQRTPRTEVRPKEVLSKVIDRYLQHIRKRKHQKRIAFTCNVDPVVLGDPLELETIFDNLVDNAVKYTYPGKEVRVNLDADESTLYVEIENYGPGILAEEKERVWERYYRGKHDDEWSGAVSGSGIGLFVVKQTVLSYGGQVRFESRPSAGELHDPQERARARAYLTKFCLTLPLHRRTR
jgi:signal transduction histidine kinase/ligand-binding sensor protein